MLFDACPRPAYSPARVNRSLVANWYASGLSHIHNEYPYRRYEQHNQGFMAGLNPIASRQYMLPRSMFSPHLTFISSLEEGSNGLQPTCIGVMAGFASLDPALHHTLRQEPVWECLKHTVTEIVEKVGYDSSCHKGPSIYDVHTDGGQGSGSGGRMWTGEGGPAPCGRPHRKLKLESYCLLLMQRSWRLFYQNFVFGQKKVEFFLQYKLVV